jgi:hypothetical protein
MKDDLNERLKRFALQIIELCSELPWLELLNDAKILPPHKIQPLYSEADELIAIFISISKKTKRRIRKYEK